MHPYDPDREAVRIAAERSWLDVVENYERGRDAWIAARLSDYDERTAVYDEIGTMLCTTDCPSGPHAHPVTAEDLSGLMRKLQR